MGERRNSYQSNDRRREIRGAKTSNPDRGIYHGSRKSREDAWKTVKKYLAVMALAGGAIGYVAGATTGPMISQMAKSFNSSNNTQASVELAAEYDNYLELVKSNLAQKESQIENMSDGNSYAETTKRLFKIEKQEKIDGVTGLNGAVKTYNELRYKKDRTFNEEKEFLDACQKICESEQVVIDVYTDAIVDKAADAYGFSEGYMKSQIEVKAPGYYNKGNGKYEYVPQINIPGKDVKLSKDLKKEVMNARCLLDEEYSFSTMSVDELPVDKIIDVYQDAIEFENYDITIGTQGELVMTERDKSEETEVKIEKSKAESEERVEREKTEEER